MSTFLMLTLAVVASVVLYRPLRKLGLGLAGGMDKAGQISRITRGLPPDVARAIGARLTGLSENELAGLAAAAAIKPEHAIPTLISLQSACLHTMGLGFVTPQYVLCLDRLSDTEPDAARAVGMAGVVMSAAALSVLDNERWPTPADALRDAADNYDQHGARGFEQLRELVTTQRLERAFGSGDPDA